jgi:nucleotide-binding universal stress UspA family protein
MDSDFIVIAYDGSDTAREAILVAARELGRRRARVLHVWEPLASARTRLAIYGSAAIMPEELDIERDQAQGIADEGAQLAREAGFDAEPVALQTDGAVAAGIVDYVEQNAPALVVMGTRGLSGLRSIVAGSVSRQVTQHVAVPVLAVPPSR